MLSKHNKCVHLVAEKKSIYLLLRLAEKNPLPAFTAKKTSRKFSQDSCKPEKNTVYGYNYSCAKYCDQRVCMSVAHV